MVANSGSTPAYFNFNFNLMLDDSKCFQLFVGLRTPTNLCTALSNFSLLCFAFYCCTFKMIQIAMHKFADWTIILNSVQLFYLCGFIRSMWQPASSKKKGLSRSGSIS